MLVCFCRKLTRAEMGSDRCVHLSVSGRAGSAVLLLPEKTAARPPVSSYNAPPSQITAPISCTEADTDCLPCQNRYVYMLQIPCVRILFLSILTFPFSEFHVSALCDHIFHHLRDIKTAAEVLLKPRRLCMGYSVLQTGSCLLNLFNLNQQHHRSTHFITHSRHTHHICRRHCFLNSLNLKTTFYKWIQYLR